MQYAQLSQNADLATTLYTSLQAALNVTRLQKDQVSGNVQITQGAVLGYLPVKPRMEIDVLLGVALGSFLSLCLVMLLEQLDQRVRTLDEVRALVSGPIIGMLPQISRKRMTALAQGLMLPEFEEPFSLVRVNLPYVMRHAMMRENLQHQTILVTSAVPGEGKSVTASQLARSMAESGKSVILVDANLRRPVQSFLFHTGETRGLANVLAGELALDEAIATSDVEGLSILHSGESRQNPTSLLSGPRLGPLDGGAAVQSGRDYCGCAGLFFRRRHAAADRLRRLPAASGSGGICGDGDAAQCVSGAPCDRQKSRCPGQRPDTAAAAHLQVPLRLCSLDRVRRDAHPAEDI